MSTRASNKPYDPSKPLISIHVPKCAGSSFTEVLKVWFGRGLLRHYFDERRNTPPKRHRLTSGLLNRNTRSNLCIHGHFNNARGFGVRDYYPQADQFITILRDPFDLHLSRYFYVKREAGSRGGGAFRSGGVHPIIANDWDLEDYLREYPRSYVGQFLPPDLTIESCCRALESRFLHIGIAERLQDSVNGLALVLGFDSVPVPEKNVSNWTERIPNGARDAFVENNPLEMAVYDFARSSFEARSARAERL